MLIYRTYRVSPKLGQALEDVIRSEPPTKKQYDHLYRLLKKHARKYPPIPRDVYMGLVEAVRRPDRK